MKEWLEKYKTSVLVKKALESDKPGGEAPDFNAAATLDQEIKKLTAANEELKKKCDKLESQMAEMRDA